MQEGGRNGTPKNDILWRRSPPMQDEINQGMMGDGQGIPLTISPIMPFLSEAESIVSHCP
ncbi:hypothetical protein J0895_01545 [Phormidium pseudopriestleyi FRX01]|uniref:Uncharacterized protein n=1 Tax=Phormidium pseudopriestleyi FRX01 TaxID=1759528 RepID=A0ABS3FL53_9CYAN|nr:hypothetical protein [Phormidium pseudopriestleyi]MBO0347812.1 hypothetical protein [Phormidium pseudopriestleyi FRX01]